MTGIIGMRPSTQTPIVGGFAAQLWGLGSAESLQPWAPGPLSCGLPWPRGTPFLGEAHIQGRGHLDGSLRAVPFHLNKGQFCQAAAVPELVGWQGFLRSLGLQLMPPLSFLSQGLIPSKHLAVQTPPPLTFQKTPPTHQQERMVSAKRENKEALPTRSASPLGAEELRNPQASAGGRADNRQRVWKTGQGEDSQMGWLAVRWHH